MANEESAVALLNENDFKSIVDAAPVALQKNTSQSDSALKAAINFVATYTESEYDDEADAKASALIVKIRKTHEDMNSRRKSLTQLLQKVTTTFTALENKIDPAKSPEVQAIQKLRDNYAAKKLKEQTDKQAEQELQLKIEQEKIDLKHDLTVALDQYFLTYQSNQRGKLFELYYNITLDKFEQQSALIAKFEIIYPFTHFTEFKFRSQRTWILNEKLKGEVWKSAKEGKFEQFQADFKKTIQEYLQELSDKLPAKKLELEEIAAADKAKKEKLLKEQQERDQQQKEKLEKQQREQEEESRNKAESTKQVDEVQTLFDHQSKVAEVVESTGPKGAIKKTVIIEVTNNAGWLAIVSLYFQQEGNMSKDDLSKVTLGSMRTYCEALAKKSNIRIDNKFITYTDGVKTISK